MISVIQGGQDDFGRFLGDFAEDFFLSFLEELIGVRTRLGITSPLFDDFEEFL